MDDDTVTTDCTCLVRAETISAEDTGPLSARVTVRTHVVVDPECVYHGDDE